MHVAKSIFLPISIFTFYYYVLSTNFCNRNTGIIDISMFDIHKDIDRIETKKETGSL